MLSLMLLNAKTVHYYESIHVTYRTNASLVFVGGGGGGGGGGVGGGGV